MSALSAGVQAPEFTLPATDGKPWSLAQARQRGPVVVAFFKVSCPVCQYALPYLQRLHEAYGRRVSIVGVSQNALRETQAFMKEYGLSLPVVLDDTRTYPVSNAYGLTNVPSLFLIDGEGEIKLSSVGWSRQDLETINAELAQAAALGRAQVFHPGEDVAEFKAG